MVSSNYRSIRIPFPTEREAEIAYDVLRVDAEPKRSFITKQLSREGNILQADFTGELAKNVRVGLTSFFQSLMLCCETIKEFGPPLEKYDHY